MHSDVWCPGLMVMSRSSNRCYAHRAVVTMFQQLLEMFVSHHFSVGGSAPRKKQQLAVGVSNDVRMVSVYPYIFFCLGREVVQPYLILSVLHISTPYQQW